MKKQLKKLKLAKETLRQLEEPGLNQIAGAATTTCTYMCGTYVCPTSNGRFVCEFACVE